MLLPCSSRVSSLGRINNIQKKIISWFLDRMAIDIAAPLNDVGIPSLVEVFCDLVFGEC